MEYELYDLDTGEAISDDHLAHVGVKGMRWGIRKVKKLGSKISPTTKRRLAIGAKITGGILAAIGAVSIVNVMSQPSPFVRDLQAHKRVEDALDQFNKGR